MCIVKTPKIEQPKQEDPEYLRNPFLDVARNDKQKASALRIGRSSLRIDRGDVNPQVGFSGRPTSGAGQAALTRSPLLSVGRGTGNRSGRGIGGGNIGGPGGGGPGRNLPPDARKLN